MKMMRRGEPQPPGEHDHATGKRAVLRERIERFRGARRRNIVGVPEFVGLAIAALLLLAALFSYFSLLLPQRVRLQRAGAERTKLQNELRLSTEGIRTSESTQSSVDEILRSLDEFENRHLVSRNEAGTAVIEELNSLIRRNRLGIASGISFTQFEQSAGNETTQQGTTRAGGRVKALQNVFPGIGVSLTVEGTYPNLRRFIRDIEADRRFIVINGVELEGVTDAGARAAAVARGQAADTPSPSGEEGAPAARGNAGSTGTALVSLRLDMAAYFRRASAAPPG